MLIKSRTRDAMNAIFAKPFGSRHSLFASAKSGAVVQLRPTAGVGGAKAGYRMASKGDRGEIYLYGPVGSSYWDGGVSANQFQQDLKALGTVSGIDLRINSEGGDVFEGRTIYSLLVDHAAPVTVYIDGLAASIASLIAMAGNKIIMADGTFMMIHNPWGVAIGDANEMRRTADLLDSVAATMIATYAARTKNDAKAIKKWMDTETWWDANESKTNQFCDEVVGQVKAAASAQRIQRPEAFKHMPDSLMKNRVAAAGVMARMRAMLPAKKT